MIKYYCRVLEYKTKNGQYPVKMACREAVDRFSKYHTQSGRGYHMHHTVLLSVIPTKEKGMFFPDKLAKDFTRYHDDIIDRYGGIVKMSATEHRQLHRELRKNGGEEQLIDYWINLLFERPA